MLLTKILFSYIVGWCPQKSWSKAAHKDIVKQGHHTCPYPLWDHVKTKADMLCRWECLGSSQVPVLTFTSYVITWHDTASWFIFRQNQFSQTWARTRTQKTNIICNLHQTASGRVHGSTEFNQSIMSSQSFKFIWSCDERQAWRKNNNLYELTGKIQHFSNISKLNRKCQYMKSKKRTE